MARTGGGVSVAEKVAQGLVPADRLCSVTERRGHAVGPHYAKRGMKVCIVHGGRLGTVKRDAEKRLASARLRALMDVWKVPVGARSEPGEVAREMITQSHYTVLRLQAAILASDPESHLVAASSTQRVGGGEYGDWLDMNLEARPSVLVQLYNEERERLMGWVFSSIKVGLRAMELKVNQESGEAMVASVRLGLVVPWLTTAQREQLAEQIGRELTRLVGNPKNPVVIDSPPPKRLTGVPPKKRVYPKH